MAETYVLDVQFLNPSGNLSDKVYRYKVKVSTLQTLYWSGQFSIVDKWSIDKAIKCHITNVNDYTYRNSWEVIIGHEVADEKDEELVELKCIYDASLVDCPRDAPIVNSLTSRQQFIDSIKTISISDNLTTANSQNWAVVDVSNTLTTNATETFCSLKDYVDEQLNKRNTEKENNKMTNIMKNFECGKTNVVKMSPFGPAFPTAENGYVAFNGNTLEDVSGMTFDMPICFLMPVGVKDVKVGDIIKRQSNNFCKITAINEDGTIEAVNAASSTILRITPAKSMFGFDFLTKVVCPFGETFNADASNPFGNPMMLMAMMNDNGDKDKMLMMALAMSQMNAEGGGAMNPWMMMAMMN